MKKYILYLIVILNIIFIPNVYALDTSIKIYDDGEFLTEEQEKVLSKRANEFVEKYKLDIVVVTSTDHANNMMNYADDFYDYNGFGVGEKASGLLLLYNQNGTDASVWISTSGDAILIYTDARLDSIISAMGRSTERTCYSFVQIFFDEAEKYAEKGVAPENEHFDVDEYGNLFRKREYPLLGVLIFSTVLTTIIISVMASKHKMIKQDKYARVYLDRRTINYIRREDRFVGTHTTRTYVPRSSGGGSHGGSSTHHSSSGRSHGGRGGRL